MKRWSAVKHAELYARANGFHRVEFLCFHNFNQMELRATRLAAEPLALSWPQPVVSVSQPETVQPETQRVTATEVKRHVPTEQCDSFVCSSPRPTS
jgi:hypothetical protein